MALKPTLCVAVATVDLALARQCLQRADDVNQLDSDGRTALGILVPQLIKHGACKQRSLLFDLLLDHGADIDAAKKRRWSPMWIAASSGRIDLVKRMVRPGKGTTSWFCRQPRRVVVQSDGARETVQVFVDRQSTELRSSNHKDSWTPLMAAVVERRFDVVLFLINAGCGGTLHDVDRFGNTVLHLLISQSSERPSFDEEQQIVDMANIVLSASGDSQSTVNAMNDIGQTAIYWAVERVLPKLCRLLIQCGANPNLGRTSHFRPLMSAINNQHLGMFDMLLQAGADPNGDVVTAGQSDVCDEDVVEYIQLYSNCFTVITLPVCAILSRLSGPMTTQLLTRLLESGVNVNRQDVEGFSPLHRAMEGIIAMDESAMNGWQELGADADDGDVQDADAQVRPWKTNIDMLLCAGADPNCPSRSGVTPLGHLAAKLKDYSSFYASAHANNYIVTAVAAVLLVLVERRDGRGASLFHQDDDTVALSDLLVYCDQRTVDLMLRMLAAGVGLHTLAEFCGGCLSDCERSPLVSVELCEAVVLLNGYRVGSEDIDEMRRRALMEDLEENEMSMQCFADWLQDRLRKPTSLNQLCRTVIRKRLASANGHINMGLLVDRLLPHCPGLNMYLKCRPDM